MAYLSNLVRWLLVGSALGVCGVLQCEEPLSHPLRASSKSASYHGTCHRADVIDM